MTRNMQRGRSSTSWSVIISWGAALLVFVGVIVMVVNRQHAPADDAAQWEAEHRAEVVRLNNDAETLALNGDWKGAHGKYQALAKLVSGHAIQETALAETVATARRNQDRIYQ